MKVFRLSCCRLQWQTFFKCPLVIHSYPNQTDQILWWCVCLHTWSWHALHAWSTRYKPSLGFVSFWSLHVVAQLVWDGWVNDTNWTLLYFPIRCIGWFWWTVMMWWEGLSLCLTFYKPWFSRQQALMRWTPAEKPHTHPFLPHSPTHTLSSLLSSIRWRFFISSDKIIHALFANRCLPLIIEILGISVKYFPNSLSFPKIPAKNYCPYYRLCVNETSCSST